MEIVNPRVIRHGREFVKHVVPAVVKPARTLWNEVIGFLFLCLAVIFGFAGVRSYFAHETVLKLVLSGFFTLVMAGFGISSFRRARKISRS